MNHTDVKVGTQIVAKVGCNEVKAVITEIGENGIMARSHKSGKEFRVKTILQVESAPEVILETPKPEKKMSLFSAAIKVMETGPVEQTYSVKELVAETIAQGLWTPGAGKTPDMTLYAAILRGAAECAVLIPQKTAFSAFSLGISNPMKKRKYYFPKAF